MKDKHDKILKVCFKRLKYFNYSQRTIVARVLDLVDGGREENESYK